MIAESLAPTEPTDVAAAPPGAHLPDGKDHPFQDIAVRCVGLEKRFGPIEVVRGVDLDAERGRLLALLGPSGCGKTTTLRLMAGLETLDAGTVEIAGRLVAGPGRDEPPERRRVGMVFQDYALFPHLSVARNVAFGLARRHETKRRMREVLDLVGLADFAERMPHELSGGQQQRVALARALAPNPAVVLLDEPFSNLDPELRLTVRREVRQILADAGATAILVTHDQEEALSLADRIAVMWDGRIIQTANPEELYHRPVDRRVAAFVGDAQFLPGEARGRRVDTVLGPLPLAGQAEGAVDVLLRPETIRLALAPEADPTNAQVTNREFFGHHQSLTVQLDAGGALRARLGSYGGIRRGDRVQVSVRGAVLAFPRATQPDNSA
ncbi:MAG: ABC transporter ATP-binding protein [Chloroflexia bacterium]|nr:ABC transporter ATP-binding protein [Chloroflexia bacterium]